MEEKLMTVGEIAREVNVSVRTLQYYDKCGLLKPSSYSEGGYRLYTNKELIVLCQIKSLKHLGLSLDEIKQHLASLDMSDKVLGLLRTQKEKISNDIEALKEILAAIELLESGIERDNAIDFAQFAKFISDAQNKWGSFWPFNIMEDDLRDHVLKKFKDETDFDKNFIEIMNKIEEEQEKGTEPGSLKGQELAADFWDMIKDFTDGNAGLLPSLLKMPKRMKYNTNDFTKNWKHVEPFIEEALGIYMTNNDDSFARDYFEETGYNL